MVMGGYSVLWFLILAVPVKLQDKCTTMFLTATCNPDIPLTVFPSNITGEFYNLDLSGNEISTLFPGNLSYYDNLLELDLSDNKITIFPAGLEQEQLQITRLVLKNNPLSVIEDNAFKYMENLLILDLEGTALTTLTTATFTGITGLEELYLRGAELTNLYNNTFELLTLIEVLELQDNNLQILPEGIFNSFTAADLLIYLTGNPWSCDCRMKWFRSYLEAKQSNFDNSNFLTCSWPYEGIPILNIPENDFNCSEPSIIDQPVNDSIVSEISYTLTIEVSGSPFPNVTWYRDNQSINDVRVYQSGLYDASLHFDNTTVNHSGVYYVQLTNEYGSVTSQPVTLTVTETSCFNDKKDDHETDVNCGGIFCKPCNQLQRCLIDRDCDGDLVCLYSYQLMSRLHYISPNDPLSYTCENVSVAKDLLNTRLQIGFQSQDLFGSNFTVEDNIETVHDSMRKILSTKLLVNEVYITDVRVTTVERLSAESRPLIQIWFNLVKNSQGRNARLTLSDLIDKGEISGTIKINETKSLYTIRINL